VMRHRYLGDRWGEHYAARMTEPLTPPTNTQVAEMFPPRFRAVVYILTVMLAAAFAVVEANIDLHWAWMAGYAAWNAAAGLLAVSSVPTSRTI
jgi:hypothetical protein